VKCPVLLAFSLSRGPQERNCTLPPGRAEGRHGGSGREPTRKLVINCARSGKDRVKDFVIAFTSSPSSAKQRPVIPFVNPTGYPHRPYGAATGSCKERGARPRVRVVDVDPPGAK
jgi:hypothetical protein